MHAGGGWDPTLLCDAKLTADGPTPEYENKLVTKVGDVNGIPVPLETKDGKFLLRSNGNPLEDPQNFFSTVGKNVLVLNGIDTQTNNHDVGVQGLACGHNNVELPALAALFAGMIAEKLALPMAFLAGGQYNRTGDVVGVSRFPGDKVGLLADPFKAATGDDKALLGDVSIQRILALRTKRLQALQAQATLPRNKRTLKALDDATRGEASLNILKEIAGGVAPDVSTFAANLAPDTVPYLTTIPNGRKTAPFVDLGAPFETILRCFKSGVSASATYAQGGFDTHANHDVAQQDAMGQFIARLRYVLLRADQLAIRDKLYVMVTSDFGRTPRYNTGNGKDHWNVSSALVMGPGIKGGRALGKTDSGHKVLRVVNADVTKTVPDDDESGTRLHASHMHGELRRLLGVDKADFIAKFPLPSTDQPLPLLV
jgi:hypothetical protein